MEEDSSSSFLGSYIHQSIPDSFHVNPYQSTVNPCKEIQQSSFSFQQYKQDLERHDNEEEEENEGEGVREVFDEHFNNENNNMEYELFDRRESERNNRRFNHSNQNQNEIIENNTHDQNQHERNISESGIELLHHQFQEDHHHSLLSPVHDNQVDLSTNSSEQIIEVEDSDLEMEDPSLSLHVNTPVRRALNSFGNFIFDIYQSSAYYLPSQYSPSRNRFQYMSEYYRRMVHLIEESNKQEAASEETIEHLCVDIFFSVDWCPICLEDYLDNMVTTVLPCGHRFHLCCIRSWLQINHKCPVCKIVV